MRWLDGITDLMDMSLSVIPGWEDPLEEGMATHSSVLAWRVPWTEEPGGLQSTGSHGVDHPGIEPRSPALQADSLPAEPPGKPKNPGVGSLSLLQGIFLTQGLNPGLLHCRRILSQLSHLGSLKAAVEGLSTML